MAKSSVQPAPQRKPFLAITDDLDQAAEALARRKGIPTLQPAEQQKDEEKTGEPDEAVPEIPDPEPEKSTSYTYVKCKCPDYLLDELYASARKERVTVNHILLKSLKSAGFTVREEDLIPDGRRIRGRAEKPSLTG